MKPAAVVFDLFGTLLDIGSLRVAAGAVCDDPVAFVAAWREKQIGYAFASAIMGKHEDFDALTLYGLRYAAARFGITLDAAAERRLTIAWEHVAAYRDAVPALEELHGAGIACAVLTNGTPATASAAMRNAGIAALVDVTLSVEGAGVFKPDRRVYELVTKHYGCSADNLIFVTSNGWDATGAAEFGMHVAWCNRLDAPAETFGAPPSWTIADLHSLPALVEAVPI